MFVCKGECLYRQRRDGNNGKFGIGHKCVVLPKSQRVMKMAHESLMGGHIGINNTMAEIKSVLLARNASGCSKLLSILRHLPKESQQG